MGKLVELLESGHGHRLLDPFVLKHGRPFTKIDVPRGIRRGKPRECYRNSLHLAKRKGWIYVEGFALLDGWHPLLHAWVVQPNKPGLAIDVTTNLCTEYYGIPLRLDYVQALYDRKGKGCWSVLDDWHSNFPILRDKPEMWLHRLDS